MLQIHRLSGRNVQDVPDKRNPAPAVPALTVDLFSTPPAPPSPLPLPLPPVVVPNATGFHVAALQLVNPMGTWRMACAQVNQGTRYESVTFRPAPARAGYRAIFFEDAS